MVNNPTFQAGECYTTFIEETPELFDLTQRTDRALQDPGLPGGQDCQRLQGGKALFRGPRPAQVRRDRPVYGAKDEFKKLGAKGLHPEDPGREAAVRHRHLYA